MDFIHTVLNLAVPPTGLTMLVFFLPTYLFFKLLISTIKSIYHEDVAGKVILITRGCPLALARFERSYTHLFLVPPQIFSFFAHTCCLKHLAYEYAKRGVCLALVARRENHLLKVAATAYQFGFPEVIMIRAYVSKVEEICGGNSSTLWVVLVNLNYSYLCFMVGMNNKIFWILMLAVNYLVNNAGVAPVGIFEHITDVTNFRSAMSYYLVKMMLVLMVYRSCFC